MRDNQNIYFFLRVPRRKSYCRLPEQVMGADWEKRVLCKLIQSDSDTDFWPTTVFVQMNCFFFAPKASRK